MENIQNSSATPPFPPQPTNPGGNPNVANPTVTQQNPNDLRAQQVPNQQNSSQPPASGNPPQKPMVTKKTRRFPKFAIFLIIFAIIVLVVWAVVGYLYLQNKKTKEENVVQEPQVSEVTPTPSFSPERIKVRNGDIIYDVPGGETKVLVGKSDYAETGITGFAKVSVSPDEKNICFESWPPAPEPALYLSNVEGGNVVEVSKNKKGCLWTTDSKNLIYTNDAGPSSTVDIYIYNISDQKETNITGTSFPVVSDYRFEVVGLSADGSKIICRYLAVDSDNTPSSCEIDIETLTVSIQPPEGTSESPSATSSSNPL